MPIVDALRTKIRNKGGSAANVSTIEQAVSTLNRMEVEEPVGDKNATRSAVIEEVG